jgi:hypothetical protein
VRRRGVRVGAVSLLVLGIALVVVPNRGLVLQAWVVAVVAVATVALVDRCRRWLPPSRRLEELLPRPTVPRAGIDQFESLRRQLLAARESDLDLHRFFRPNVIELAAVRLAREHGVDLRSEPEQARALVGASVWELVRPDRPRPVSSYARGWSLRQLQTLVHELEEI